MWAMIRRDAQDTLKTLSSHSFWFGEPSPEMVLDEMVKAILKAIVRLHLNVLINNPPNNADFSRFTQAYDERPPMQIYNAEVYIKALNMALMLPSSAQKKVADGRDEKAVAASGVQSNAFEQYQQLSEAGKRSMIKRIAENLYDKIKNQETEQVPQYRFVINESLDLQIAHFEGNAVAYTLEGLEKGVLDEEILEQAIKNRISTEQMPNEELERLTFKREYADAMTLGINYSARYLQIRRGLGGCIQINKQDVGKGYDTRSYKIHSYSLPQALLTNPQVLGDSIAAGMATAGITLRDKNSAIVVTNGVSSSPVYQVAAATATAAAAAVPVIVPVPAPQSQSQAKVNVQKPA